jgi:hypothetical protein
MVLFVILSLVAILFQGIVIYYSYTLFKLVRQLKVWALAWGVFATSMGVVVFRRVWSLYSFLHVDGPVASNMYNRYFEVIILLVTTTLWVIFVYLLKNIFSKYLGPHANDLTTDREDAVQEREDVIQEREDVTSGRESAVGKREELVRKEEILDRVKHVEVLEPKQVVVEKVILDEVGFDKRTIVVENPNKVSLADPKKVVLKRREDILNNKIVNGR